MSEVNLQSESLQNQATRGDKQIPSQRSINDFIHINQVHCTILSDKWAIGHKTSNL